uniref:Uncharacterized protein n=1 Tax=Vespula pensylvanica TaxID=30213 RepID=A0A834PCC1_VESPE|nr:hypothetical protein H0235_003696 [Vespula pensylvanica]
MKKTEIGVEKRTTLGVFVSEGKEKGKRDNVEIDGIEIRLEHVRCNCRFIGHAERNPDGEDGSTNVDSAKATYEKTTLCVEVLLCNFGIRRSPFRNPLAKSGKEEKRETEECDTLWSSTS